MSEQDPGRLDRIEAKLDQLVEVVATLARVEERQNMATQRLVMLERNLNLLTERLTALETTSHARGSGLQRVERGAWVVLTAAIGAVFYYFRG